MTDNKTKYKKNFITSVIFRIDFPLILQIKEETPKEFQNKILSAYPILEPIQNIEVHIQDDENGFSSNKDISTTWNFYTSDKNAWIELSSNHLALVTKKYTEFSAYFESIKKIIDAFNSCYENILINRIGLRYVNQIKLSETDIFEWKKYINEELLGGLNLSEDKNNLKRIMQSTEIKVDEDTDIKIINGIYNSLYPSTIKQKEYVLDFDCYSQIETEKEKICEKIESYHSTIEDYFEKNITDEFRKHLND